MKQCQRTTNADGEKSAICAEKKDGKDEDYKDATSTAAVVALRSLYLFSFGPKYDILVKLCAALSLGSS